MNKETSLITTSQVLQKLESQLVVSEKLLVKETYTFILYTNYEYAFLKSNNFNSTDFEMDVIDIKEVNRKSIFYFFSEKGNLFKLDFSTLFKSNQNNLTSIIELKGEKIISLDIEELTHSDNSQILLATEQGYCKRISSNGFKLKKKYTVIKLHPNDFLCSTILFQKDPKYILIGDSNKVIRFEFIQIPMQKNRAYGKKAMTPMYGKVINLDLAYNDTSFVFHFSKTHIKKSALEDYRITNKGEKGVISFTRNQSAINFFCGPKQTEFLIFSDKKTILNHKITVVNGEDFRVMGRAVTEGGIKFKYGEIKKVVKLS